MVPIDFSGRVFDCFFFTRILRRIYSEEDALREKLRLGKKQILKWKRY